MKFAKKPTPAAKPAAAAKRNPIFGQDDDDNVAVESTKKSDAADNAEIIVELDADSLAAVSARPPSLGSHKSKPTTKQAAALPRLSGRAIKDASVMFGDLSSTFESQKRGAAAQQLDPTIYDYDAVYDTLKAPATLQQDDAAAADSVRRPKYMDSMMAAAAVKKRDWMIAEEKKIARERAAEGDEFADREKFVTRAYLRLQEENRRVEEEERQREEAEARKANRDGGGMTAFYKSVLEREEERHREVVRAAEELQQQRREGGEGNVDMNEEVVGVDENGIGDGREGGTRENDEADIARAMNQKGANVVINEEGQVVDKRDLLRGGLNVARKGGNARRQQQEERQHGRNGSGRGRHGAEARHDSGSERPTGGRVQERLERETATIEEHLLETLKRARAEEAEEQERIERAAKSRKTAEEIEGARERYLRRKREAAEGGGK